MSTKAFELPWVAGYKGSSGSGIPPAVTIASIKNLLFDFPLSLEERGQGYD
jgi:hypothetical protein